MNSLPPIVVTDEALKDQPDLMGQILYLQQEAYRQHLIDKMAEECGDRAFAELFYMPALGIPFF